MGGGECGQVGGGKGVVGWFGGRGGQCMEDGKGREGGGDR